MKWFLLIILGLSISLLISCTPKIVYTSAGSTDLSTLDIPGGDPPITVQLDDVWCAILFRSEGESTNFFYQFPCIETEYYTSLTEIELQILGGE